MLLVLASQASQLHAFVIVLAFGLIVAVFGHIFRSRTMILTGLFVIGAASAYFTFVLEPGSR